MGILDKAKAQAQQAVAKAHQGVAQGQAKLDTMAAKKHGDALLRDLGAAYYAQTRSGGSADAVTAALAKLDEHSSAHGPIDTAATAPPTPDAAAGDAEGAGGYNLDEI